MPTDTNRKSEDHRDKARERSRHDDPTRETDRQLDDNQDDLGRDANHPGRISNDINKTERPEVDDD